MDFLKKYNIKITNEELLLEALTHSSYSNEHNCPNYERLEFLGDAILEAITSEYFYLNTDEKEGAMSKIRASYVCENALAFYAKQIGIDKYIRVGNGQLHDINDTIVADVFESVLAVIFLECGFDIAKKYIYETVIPYIKEEKDFLTDYKSKLQELVQTDKKSLEYEVINESGPAHDKTFEVIVKIENIVYGNGIGKSKKEAEQNAALDALNKCAK